MQSRGKPGAQVTRQQMFRLMEDNSQAIDDCKPVLRTASEKIQSAKDAMASYRGGASTKIPHAAVNAMASHVAAAEAGARPCHGSDRYPWMPWIVWPQRWNS